MELNNRGANFESEYGSELAEQMKKDYQDYEDQLAQ